MINKVILSGNLTRDVELKQAGEHQVAHFTIAVSDGWGEQKKTYFVDCNAWNKLAVLICDNCKKGSKICVCGKLTQRSYEGRDGTKKTSTEIEVQDVELIFQEKKADDLPFITAPDDLDF